MDRRKIQLIAGTTYSVSLPKDWVRKNNLKERDEVIMMERSDRTLVLSAQSVERKDLLEISLNVDEYMHDIDQILFAIYYLGVENIHLFSKKELSKEVKARIRKTLVHMSGTEISFEDRQKITIRVLLDKSRVDLMQVLYRITLIIDSSLANLMESVDIGELDLNENEVDRLYHLMTKIISLSLKDSSVLQSSKIRHVSLVPSYFLIGKKLENIADAIYELAKQLQSVKVSFESKKEFLSMIRSELARCTDHLLRSPSKIFEKMGDDRVRVMESQIARIRQESVANQAKDMLRYIIDLQEEVVNISFYNKMIMEHLL